MRKAEELNLRILNPVRLEEEESTTEKEEIVEEAEVENK